MDSTPGADVCDLATADYFLDPANDFRTAECPENAECRGGLDMPRPQENFWVDRSEARFASSIYPCSRSSCTGATTKDDDDDDDGNNEGESGSRRLATFAAADGCWTIDAYNTSSRSAEQAAEEEGPCDTDKLQCTAGSTGPLCGSCKDGYTFNSAQSQCVACESASFTTPIIIVGVFGLIVLVITVLRWRGVSMKALQRLPSFSLLKHIDKGTLKVRGRYDGLRLSQHKDCIVSMI
jgi:hypothetical protein